MAYLLAIDAGTGAGKCVIFDLQGRVVGYHREPWSYRLREGGDSFAFVRAFDFDPPEFWRVIGRCLRGALAQGHVRREEVRAMAVTGQRLACVFLDEGKREIYAGPNIDARAFAEGMEILERLGAEQLYRITGHSAPFIFPLARYLWYRRHGDRRVGHVLAMTDWLTYKLTGEICAEPSTAGDSMFFEVARRVWSKEILDHFEISGDILPPLRRPGEIVGKVGRDAAEEAGLVPGTPVCVGGGDTQCALLGSGSCEDGQAAAVLGATAPVQMVTADPRFDPDNTLWVGCHVLDEKWVLESNAGDAGNAYQWLWSVLGEQGQGLDHAEAFLQREAPAVEEGGPNILSYIGPSIFDLRRINPFKPAGILFRSPLIVRRHPTRAELLRAFLDSVAFAIKANCAKIQAVCERPLHALFVSGGLSQSRLLLQIHADVIGLPLLVSQVTDSAALGGAILAAVGTGLYGDMREAVHAMVRHQLIEPREREGCRYQEHYRQWCELYRVLGDLTL